MNSTASIKAELKKDEATILADQTKYKQLENAHLVDETTISKDQSTNAKLSEWHTKDQEELTKLKADIKITNEKTDSSIKKLT